MNGQYLDGRTIKLDSATQRDRTNSGGQGGQGGRGSFGGAGGRGSYGGGNNRPGAVSLTQDDKNAKKGAISTFAGKKTQL